MNLIINQFCFVHFGRYEYETVTAQLCVNMCLVCVRVCVCMQDRTNVRDEVKDIL